MIKQTADERLLAQKRVELDTSVGQWANAIFIIEISILLIIRMKM